MRQKNNRAPSANGDTAHFNNQPRNYTALAGARNRPVSRKLPSGWKSRLPSGYTYYGKRVEKLSKPNQKGWMQGRCPFHDDKHLSLSVHYVHGGWRCFAGCGQGDLVDFHCRITGKTFLAAVRDLTGGRHE